MIQKILSKLITGKGVAIVFAVFSSLLLAQQLRIWFKDVQISNRDKNIVKLEKEITRVEVDNVMLNKSNKDNVSAYDEINKELHRCVTTSAANEQNSLDQVKKYEDSIITIENKYETIKNKLPKDGCGNSSDVDDSILHMVNGLYKD